MVRQNSPSHAPIVLLSASRGTQRYQVARTPARFRAFPDDTGIALKGDKPVACVGPILKLLDRRVIARLTAGSHRGGRPRDIDKFGHAVSRLKLRPPATRARACT